MAGDLATWDYELLLIELSQLRGMGVDLKMIGFSEDELAKLLDPGVKEGLTDPDDIPIPPDEPVTRPGDLWILGDHRLLCGDAGNVEHVDRLLDAARIDLVNTDPPYNVRVEPRSNNAIAAALSSFQGPKQHQRFDVERYPEKAQATHRKMRAKDRPLKNDFVSDEEFDRMLHALFGNIARVLLPGRGFYIWGGYANCANYPPVLKACKLYFSQAIIRFHGTDPAGDRADPSSPGGDAPAGALFPRSRRAAGRLLQPEATAGHEDAQGARGPGKGSKHRGRLVRFPRCLWGRHRRGDLRQPGDRGHSDV